MFNLKRFTAVAFVVPFAVLSQKKNVLVLELVPLTCGKYFKSHPPKKGSCLSLGGSFQNFRQAPYIGVPQLPLESSNVFDSGQYQAMSIKHISLVKYVLSKHLKSKDQRMPQKIAISSQYTYR